MLLLGILLGIMIGIISMFYLFACAMRGDAWLNSFVERMVPKRN